MTESFKWSYRAAKVIRKDGKDTLSSTVVTGSLNAESGEMAIFKLLQQGLYPLEVTKSSSADLSIFKGILDFFRFRTRP
jgi:type II secretory pathway component PulF